jgi:hypothetical protein
MTYTTQANQDREQPGPIVAIPVASASPVIWSQGDDDNLFADALLSYGNKDVAGRHFNPIGLKYVGRVKSMRRTTPPSARDVHVAIGLDPRVSRAMANKQLAALPTIDILLDM